MVLSLDNVVPTLPGAVTPVVADDVPGAPDEPVVDD